MSTNEPPFQLDYIYVEALAVKLARVERPFQKKMQIPGMLPNLNLGTQIHLLFMKLDKNYRKSVFPNGSES